MSNKDIIRLFRRTADLLTLHGENEFKAKAYQSAIYKIENSGDDFTQKSDEEIKALGLSQNMVQKIRQVITEETFTELEEWLSKTPIGVVDMLGVQGLGAKKVRALWQELGVENLSELLRACEEGLVAKLKGFGEKTQTKIAESVRFRKAQQGKFLYADAEPYVEFLEKKLEECDKITKQSRIGTVRRQLEIIEEIEILVATEDRTAVRKFLNELDDLSADPQASSPFVWRGNFDENQLQVIIRMVSPATFSREQLLHSGAEAHFRHSVDGKTLFKLARTEKFNSEEEFYEKVGWKVIPSPMREGSFEIKAATDDKLPEKLLQTDDLRGILHAHSTYSDGKHTLRQMAEACKEQGFDYLGITDHSQTAYYASGLKFDEVKRQHEEIDKLNEELAPFRIFKGIESDILNDGALDYTDAELETFDFIIASVHANLRMDRKKATERVLRAV
ncbi:MAG: PHP domain-containing protein, partial [Bacteroidota bacterium]